MKLCTSYLLLLVALAPRVRAESTALALIEGTFKQCIESQRYIKNIEEQSHKKFSIDLNAITRELHKGLNSDDIFMLGSIIHNNLVDVNLKVGQISGNATSIITQIQSAAVTIKILHFDNARTDYNFKKNRIKMLCADIVKTTDIILQLIDETKEKLTEDVSRPLKMLNATIQLSSGKLISEEEAKIKQQQTLINNTVMEYCFVNCEGVQSKYYNAVKAAEDLKNLSEDNIKRIGAIVKTIMVHVVWLEMECRQIRADLDAQRTKISRLEGSAAAGNIGVMLTEVGDDAGDEDLRKASRNLVKVMKKLRDEA